MKSSSIPAICMVLLLAGCQSTQMASLFKTPSFLKKNSQKKQSSQAVADNSDNMLNRRANQKLSSKERKNVKSIMKQAESALAQGDLQQARKFYLQAALNDPKNPEVNHGLAIVADQMKSFETAERYYLAAIEADATNPDILANLGYSYLLQNRYQESEQYLKKALALNRNHRKAAINLGDLYGKTGDYDQALAMFRLAGTEAEAQANIARLFPNGRVLNASATRGGLANQNAPNRFASNHTAGNEFAANSLGTSAPNPNAPGGANSSGFQDAPNDATRDLKMKMEQARLASRARRLGKQSNLADYQNKRRDSEPFPTGIGQSDRDLQAAIQDIDRSALPQNRYSSMDQQRRPWSGDNATAANTQSSVPPLGIPRQQPRPQWPANSEISQTTPDAFPAAQETPQQLHTATQAQQAGQPHKKPSQPETSLWPPTVPEDNHRANAHQPNAEVHASATHDPSRSNQFEPMPGIGNASFSQNEMASMASTNAVGNGQQHQLQPTPSMVPNMMPSSDANPSASPMNSYEQAKRQAAAIGLGAGPGQMFPMENHTQRYNQTPAYSNPRMSRTPSWNGGTAARSAWDTTSATPTSNGTKLNGGQPPISSTSMTAPANFNAAVYQSNADQPGETSTMTSAWEGGSLQDYEKLRQQHSQEYQQMYDSQQPAGQHPPAVGVRTSQPGSDYPQWNDHIMRNRSFTTNANQHNGGSPGTSHSGQSQPANSRQHPGQQNNGELPVITPGRSR